MPDTKSELVVVGIGEILWDLLPRGRQLGGAPTNFAYHTSTQGFPAAAVSCVGEDALGRALLDQVAAWGMPTEFLTVRPDYPTGTVTVALDAKGVPAYEIHTEVAWDHLPWSESLSRLAPTLRAVCFGTLSQRSPESRATIQRFVRATAPSCLRVCDINLRQQFYDDALLHESLSLATVLKLNHEELPLIAASVGLVGTPIALLTQLCERFTLSLVALTRGSNGSLLVTPDALSECAGLSVEVIDTIGAGDAFTAALVAGLLRGDTLDTINEAANRTAAATCQHAGAIP